MCGIGGVIRTDAQTAIDEPMLLRMAAAVRHRGPDGFGIALEPGAGLVSTRLAIFDIPGGWQPMQHESGSLIVYNGEVYNHPELRAELEATGERLQTSCDTEVVLRLLERNGLSALDRFNGQFALAWWQPEERRLTLIRDRFGVRPLYYTLLGDGSIVFASEAKGIFASELVQARPDPAGLEEIFTLWGPRAPRTAFAGVQQVRPGGVIVWEDGEVVTERRWWTPEPHRVGAAPSAEELETLMADSIRLRLRADVPVGAYLSGGLDSSLITAIAQREIDHELRTFSLAFHDGLYDERPHQEEVARAIGTLHHVMEIGPQEIASALPEVVWHTEMPLVRTAPVPMYLLARAVRADAISVVATGEGADELFWGYDLFKEVALRELAQESPEKAAELLDGLYDYLGPATARRGPAFRRFILETGAGDDLLASHLTRAQATSAVKAFFTSEFTEAIASPGSLDRLRDELPTAFGSWSRLERASWLEITTLLEPYLLSVQGDRPSMGNGIEGRYPFLDHRVFDCASSMSEPMKLDGMRDKGVLRDLAERLLPESIARRTKQPYRAPGISPFFAEGAPEWVEELLGLEALEAVSIWDPGRVSGLLRRCRSGMATGAREEMAFVAVISTQLWHRAFMDQARDWPQEAGRPRVRIERFPETTRQQRVGV